MEKRWCLLVAFLLVCACGHAASPADLVPPVKQTTDYGRHMSLGRPADIAIVLGKQATDPERYAAGRLNELLERRFGVTFRICAEGRSTADAPVRIIVGQAHTNSLVKALCQKRQIRLPWYSPGHDAYVIEVLDDKRTILVCGSNDRGVIYGVQTLFRLIERQRRDLVAPVCFIRDWPSIPWRGRPYTSVGAHLEPGVMDAYLWAGLNFIDVRAGAFGYAPDADLDKEAIGRCIREAHRRGMFVYGTVSCGVKPEKFDGALRTFRELIELGVDGLWISFDDPGGGRGTTDLVRRVIDMGRKTGFTGREIATTPPSGSYQYIDTEFNRQMVRVAGMQDATWLFTRNPCRDDLAATRQLGLVGFPAWWHNWPRADAGFTHGSYGGTSFRADGKPSYMETPPLTWGWHNPQYDALRDGAANTDTVMMWGGWQPEYTCAVLGIWAWDPQRHDFAKTRRAIYDTVFGPQNVERMVTFDDDLHELKGLFLLPQRAADPKDNFPPRLKSPVDHDAALDLAAKMRTCLAKVKPSAPSASLLSDERLEALFLEPMSAELRVGESLAALKRPEDWWPAHDAACLSAYMKGDAERVKQLADQVRPKLVEQLAALVEAVGDLRNMDQYEELWMARARDGVRYCQEELERRAKAFAHAVAGWKSAGLDAETLINAIGRPPAGGKLVAQVPPTALAASAISSRGAWATGIYPSKDPMAFVMSFPHHTRSVSGDYCQVTFTVDLPESREKLGLQLHLTDEYDSDVWTGYRFYQLLHEGAVVWEEDIALTRHGGGEWSSIDISGIAAGNTRLTLTLRLLDKRPVANYQTTIFVGPVRVVTMP